MCYFYLLDKTVKRVFFAAVYKKIPVFSDNPKVLGFLLYSVFYSCYI